jgi:hypothetical protein
MGSLCIRFAVDIRGPEGIQRHIFDVMVDADYGSLYSQYKWQKLCNEAKDVVTGLVKANGIEGVCDYMLSHVHDLGTCYGCANELVRDGRGSDEYAGNVQQKTWNKLTEQLKATVTGMVETSGLPVHHQLDTASANHRHEARSGGCSACAAHAVDELGSVGGSAVLFG